MIGAPGFCVWTLVYSATFQSSPLHLAGGALGTDTFGGERLRVRTICPLGCVPNAAARFIALLLDPLALSCVKHRPISQLRFDHANGCGRHTPHGRLTERPALSSSCSRTYTRSTGWPDSWPGIACFTSTTASISFHESSHSLGAVIGLLSNPGRLARPPKHFLPSTT